MRARGGGGGALVRGLDVRSALQGNNRPESCGLRLALPPKWRSVELAARVASWPRQMCLYVGARAPVGHQHHGRAELPHPPQLCYLFGAKF